MPTPRVTITEFARQLCVANHDVRFATGLRAQQGVPCAEHINDASRYWGLTQPAGAKTLGVIASLSGAVGPTQGQAVAPVPGAEVAPLQPRGALTDELKAVRDGLGDSRDQAILDRAVSALSSDATTMEAYRDALIWMTGLQDFSPGNKAYEGFRRLVLPLLGATARARTEAVPTMQVHGTVTESHMDGDVRVIDHINVESVDLKEGVAPWPTK